MGEEKLKGINYKLTFGKYKGFTIKDLIDIDPNYILWAHETISWFKVNDYVLQKVEDAIELLRYNEAMNYQSEDYDGSFY